MIELGSLAGLVTTGIKQQEDIEGIRKLDLSQEEGGLEWQPTESCF